MFSTSSDASLFQIEANARCKAFLEEVAACEIESAQLRLASSAESARLYREEVGTWTSEVTAAAEETAGLRRLAFQESNRLYLEERNARLMEMSECNDQNIQERHIAVLQAIELENEERASRIEERKLCDQQTFQAESAERSANQRLAFQQQELERFERVQNSANDKKRVTTLFGNLKTTGTQKEIRSQRDKMRRNAQSISLQSLHCFLKIAKTNAAETDILSGTLAALASVREENVKLKQKNSILRQQKLVASSSKRQRCGLEDAGVAKFLRVTDPALVAPTIAVNSFSENSPPLSARRFELRAKDKMNRFTMDFLSPGSLESDFIGVLDEISLDSWRDDMFAESQSLF